MASRLGDGAAAGVVLSARGVRALVADLRALIEEGRARAEAAVGRELVWTYHAVGSRILEERLSGRAGYGSGIVAQVAEEVGVSARVLQEAVAFARVYPALPEGVGQLRWAHYRELMRIEDAQARRWYEREAARQGWSRVQLSQAIGRGRAARALGAGAGKVAEGAAQLKRPREAVWVYKATVERVVDGDTVILVIDLGFEVAKRQRVRLAAVDAPGLRAAGGKEAAAYVREALARVAFVMLKTVKVDIYGRYVGHLFYAPGVTDAWKVFTRGRYLNQELVSAGLARAV